MSASGLSKLADEAPMAQRLTYISIYPRVDPPVRPTTLLCFIFFLCSGSLCSTVERLSKIAMAESVLHVMQASSLLGEKISAGTTFSIEAP